MKKPIIVVDIDDTISVPGDRIKLINGADTDWELFYQQSFDDVPITRTVNMLLSLSRGYSLVFFTARSERVRKQTEKWLFERFGVAFSSTRLYMRLNGDDRPDYEVKRDMLRDHGLTPSLVHFVIDDNESVCEALRDLGYNVLRVM